MKLKFPYVAFFVKAYHGAVEAVKPLHSVGAQYALSATVPVERSTSEDPHSLLEREVIEAFQNSKFPNGRGFHTTGRDNKDKNGYPYRGPRSRYQKRMKLKN